MVDRRVGSWDEESQEGLFDMAQGSTGWSTGELSDDRAVAALLRAVEGGVPGFPVEVAVVETDGKEHRLRAGISRIDLEGMSLDITCHHGLIGKSAQAKLTVWVGSSMFRFKCRFRPGKGRAIDIAWGEVPKGAFNEPVHLLGHAPVKPQPLVLTSSAEPPAPMPRANSRKTAPAARPADVTRLPTAAQYGDKPRGKLAKMYRFMQLFGHKT
jgi:hypothetical protein